MRLLSRQSLPLSREDKDAAHDLQFTPGEVEAEGDFLPRLLGEDGETHQALLDPLFAGDRRGSRCVTTVVIAVISLLAGGV